MNSIVTSKGINLESLSTVLSERRRRAQVSQLAHRRQIRAARQIQRQIAFLMLPFGSPLADVPAMSTVSPSGSRYI